MQSISGRARRKMSKALLFLVVCCVVAVWSAPQKPFYRLDMAEQLFEDFIIEYERQYENEIEKQRRFEIFQDALKDINERNNRSESATFGINHFADMTKEEFRQSFACFKPISMEDGCSAGIVNSAGHAPDEFDWRKQNKVTDVKDQGTCGSCWAFSSTGNLEGQYAIKHNQLVAFSEQQLVDCDKTDQGCRGGLMDQAFMWLKDNGGIQTEQDYPYTGSGGSCKFDKSKVAATVAGCRSFDGTSEDRLKDVLVSTGPLAIAVDASDFMRYTGGVLENCSFGILNHGVLLVGYGTENSTPFWIIKNSWSKNWGEQGYIRVKMHQNACGMTDYVKSAVVN